MQNIVIEKPYSFIPPHRGNWWPTVIQWFNLYGRHLRKSEGVVSHEIRHEDRLRRSLANGDGIMLAPNHTRPGDPLVLGWLARRVGCHVFGMASWHLFNQDWFTAWSIRKMGGFSVNREGVDRQAINTAIDILDSGERPLIVFPEGAVSRTNDHLHALLDGVAFIARTAAKRRQKRQGGSVVIHPVALKYLFRGDLATSVDDVLTKIEHRFTWRPQRDLDLLTRVFRAGRALLCLKELQYLGKEQTGTLQERRDALIDRLLSPLEEEWIGSRQEAAVVPRVKALRMKLLPEMVHGEVGADEHERRWNQLADIYLAQQISCYLPEYLKHPSIDRIVETIERYEEALTDKSRVHGDLHVIIEVGERIEVSTQRDRKASVDPLMARLERDLQAMLERLATESPLYNSDA